MTLVAGLDLRALDRARVSRDPRFDGRFFIAVTSTRIYCRPVCPVPSPKRSNIRYFATAEAAAEAGFRPCLRCRPEAAPGTPAWDGTSAIVRLALRLIEAGALNRASVEALAAQVGVGRRNLHRLFVEHVGAAPIAVAHTRRLHFAKRLLDDTSLPITQVALAAGFGSVRRFNGAFRDTYGRPPRAVRRQRAHAAVEGGEVVLRLTYRPPYDWPHVRAFLAARTIAGVECVDDRGYVRSVDAPHGHVVVCVRPIEGEHALELRVRGAEAASLFALSATARRAFDLAADPMLIAAAFESDRLLGPLARRHPGLRIPGAWDPFECAVRAIVGQQVSVAAGRTLLGRIVSRAGRAIADGGAGVTHVFPRPDALASAPLDGLGLTRARVDALHALACAVADGRVDFTAPPDVVTRALGALPGIGAWTAQYVALRARGDPDAFPSGDLILRRMAGAAGAPLTASALEIASAAWRPWRGYAVIHLWRAASEAAVTASTSARRPRS